MSVRIESGRHVVTAYLEGELDHHEAGRIREQLDAEILATQALLLILDFTAVSFMDSSGIGLVMGRYRQMQFQGGQVQVTGVSPAIAKVMRLSGLERLVTIEEGGVKRP